jgi:hypothetical protein
MVGREFYVGLLAYHLVRTLMWQSATAKGTDPLQLSFVQALNRIVQWMECWNLLAPVNVTTAPRWLRDIREKIVRCRLTRRRKPRMLEVRMVRCRPPSKQPDSLALPSEGGQVRQRDEGAAEGRAPPASDFLIPPHELACWRIWDETVLGNPLLIAQLKWPERCAAPRQVARDSPTAQS